MDTINKEKSVLKWLLLKDQVPWSDGSGALGQKNKLVQPPTSLENFPQKSYFFQFLVLFWSKKSLWVGSKKYPGQSWVSTLFTTRQRYARVGSDQGTSIVT